MNPTIVAHEIGHLLSGEHGDGIQDAVVYSVNGDTAQLREYRTIMTTAFPLGLDQYNYLWRFSDANATVTGDVICGELNGVPKTCSLQAEVALGDSSSNVVPKLRSMAQTTAAFLLGSADLKYQWNRDNIPIIGATESTYVLSQDDAGAEITVTASYTDGLGTDESVTSQTLSVMAYYSGDANQDGVVDIADLGTLGANFNKTNAQWTQGDFNGDGVVDVADLGIIGANWGTGNAVSALANHIASNNKISSLGSGRNSLLQRPIDLPALLQRDSEHLLASIIDEHQNTIGL